MDFKPIKLNLRTYEHCNERYETFLGMEEKDCPPLKDLARAGFIWLQTG